MQRCVGDLNLNASMRTYMRNFHFAEDKVGQVWLAFAPNMKEADGTVNVHEMKLSKLVPQKAIYKDKMTVISHSYGNVYF